MRGHHESHSVQFSFVILFILSVFEQSLFICEHYLVSRWTTPERSCDKLLNGTLPLSWSVRLPYRCLYQRDLVVNWLSSVFIPSSNISFSFSPLVQFNLLHSMFHLCSVPTRALLLSAYIKFINLFPEVKTTIQDVLRSDSQLRNADVELQQRAVEYLRLSCIASTDTLVSELYCAWSERHYFYED